MTKLTPEQQKTVLEAHGSKIAKPMRALVKDATRIPDVLDDASLAKLKLFLLARIEDMMRDLVIARSTRAARTVFSLDAPVETVMTMPAVMDGAVVMGAKGRPPVVTAPAPRAPQPAVVEDDEDDLAMLVDELEDEEPVAPPAKTVASFEMAPEPHDPTKPPKKWVKPTGRLVGTNQPVWVNTEPPRAAGDAPTEKPDQTGYIRDAGFLEAE